MGNWQSACGCNGPPSRADAGGDGALVRARLERRFAPHAYRNTPTLVLQGRCFVGRLVDAYDADTLTVIVELHRDVFQRLVVRLKGVDACEMDAECARARSLAVRARDRVVAHLTHNALPAPPLGAAALTRVQLRKALDARVCLVHVEVHGTDRYGRCLGDLRPFSGAVGPASAGSGGSAAALLLEERLACPYDGKGARLSARRQTEQLLALEEEEQQPPTEKNVST